jgi:hypothetical protein
MDVAIIVPMQASEARVLSGCLGGIFAQRYTGGRIEVIVVQYGGGPAPEVGQFAGRDVSFLALDNPTPYAARNLGAARANGDAFLFSEPGCVPDPDWVAAHVERLRDGCSTISVGHVVPARTTHLVETLLAYENVRDEWVFSSPHWQHYFGRPKNMAVARRRFATHGPFAEVSRGADSKLVQKVAREVGCGEIALTPTAIVRQQSIRGLPSFLRDRFGHSYALETHQSAHAAPITLGDRVALFRETVRRRHYGQLQAATLLMVLGAGILAFRAGGWSGAVTRKLTSRGS